jgi:galactose-1-phosphate uridylyltransferase
MAIQFKKETVPLKFLDYTNNFREQILLQERRVDPLTGHISIVHPGRYRRMEKPDLSGLLQQSLEMGCPFCPPMVDKAIPKFPSELFPEGKVVIGEVRVFPNALPWLQYNAIAVLTREHFVEPSDLTVKVITDGLLGCQAYLKRLQEVDAKAKYCFVFWNHLPPAGATLIHPHLQAIATQSGTKYHRQLLDASQRYHRKNGSNFWSDFITREKELGERYIGVIGNIVWLTNFVSKGWVFDVSAIFQRNDSIVEASTEDFDAFSEGLIRVFRYIRDQNLSSFNVNLYSGIIGKEYFWTQARIVPRLALPPFNTPDCQVFELFHDETLNLRRPEDICQELKEYFH